MYYCTYSLSLWSVALGSLSSHTAQASICLHLPLQDCKGTPLYLDVTFPALILISGAKLEVLSLQSLCLTE